MYLFTIFCYQKSSEYVVSRSSWQSFLPWRSRGAPSLWRASPPGIESSGPPPPGENISNIVLQIFSFYRISGSLSSHILEIVHQDGHLVSFSLRLSPAMRKSSISVSHPVRKSSFVFNTVFAIPGDLIQCQLKCNESVVIICPHTDSGD